MDRMSVTCNVMNQRVTWAASVPVLVFLGLSSLDLGTMYATDRRQTENVRRASPLNAPYPRGGGITSVLNRSSVIVVD